MRNWFKKQNDEMIELQVDDTERRIIVRALADLRDKQRLAQKNYDFLDSLIVKVCDADSYILLRDSSTFLHDSCIHHCQFRYHDSGSFHRSSVLICHHHNNNG